MDYGWVGADVFRGKVQVDSENFFTETSASKNIDSSKNNFLKNF